MGMADKKTVFIIGAGASTEAGLKTSDQLKEIIADKLDIGSDYLSPGSKDQKLIQTFTTHYQANFSTAYIDLDPYLQAANLISKGILTTRSIDEFIHLHAGNEMVELCGKLAIVDSILESEKGSSNLYLDGINTKIINYRNLSNTWYNKFIYLLAENCQKSNLKEVLTKRFNNITLIIFNYDRCVEHFLFHALQDRYGIFPPESMELVQALEIYHPYGLVGYLPWQNKGTGIEFGGDPAPDKLLELSSKINTFTQGIHAASDIDHIRGKIIDADTVVFLGFHFHEINMKLLSYEDIAFHDDLVNSFATAKGFSPSDAQIIEDEIRQLCKTNNNNVNLINNTCIKLFDEYSKSMSVY